MNWTSRIRLSSKAMATSKWKRSPTVVGTIATTEIAITEGDGGAAVGDGFAVDTGAMAAVMCVAGASGYGSESGCDEPLTNSPATAAWPVSSLRDCAEGKLVSSNRCQIGIDHPTR
ncbi:hypothetical protein GCM10007881_27690 [Mesorhizobium huakuii]|nr:hypothetical protein GCM10007881_27690 [Mesorhizobium huakuii]